MAVRLLLPVTRGARNRGLWSAVDSLQRGAQPPPSCAAAHTPPCAAAARTRFPCAFLARRVLCAAAGGPPVATAPSGEGRLHLIIGPMFAGKTTELLRLAGVEEARLVSLCQSRGRRVLVAKSNRDGRYSTSEVVSHDGLRRPCQAVQTLSSLYDTAEYQEAHVVAVDEAQFFTDLREFCVTAVDKHRKTLLVAGLDGDFRRQPFGQILLLVPHADQVTKKAGRCKRCSSASLFSLRTVADSRTELVGGSDSYEPACRDCYNAAAVAAGAAAQLVA